MDEISMNSSNLFDLVWLIYNSSIFIGLMIEQLFQTSSYNFLKKDNIVLTFKKLIEISFLTQTTKCDFLLFSFFLLPLGFNLLLMLRNLSQGAWQIYRLGPIS